jgi:hypothetical protein
MKTPDLDTQNKLDGALIDAGRLLWAAVIMVDDPDNSDLTKRLIFASMDKIHEAEELVTQTNVEPA